MKPVSEKYNIIKELIGKGSSALVYKIIDLINNKIYAVKESLSKEAEFLFKNEINIFNIFQNRNPYIVHFYNYKILPHKINLELEYCQYGSLRDLLKKAKKKRITLTENEISSIIYMVLTGLDFMHKNNLINRDVKCKNILVNKEGLAKLCDFGISQIYTKDLYPKSKAGSPYWMAPELINMQKYNQSIDIWSLGITCIELAEFEPPYINYDKNEALNKIKKNPPHGLPLPQKWSREFNTFVTACLNINKFKRPSCQELLQFDFIKNIDKKKLNRKLIILQMLSRIGCKVIYSKKTPVIKTTGIRKNNNNDNDINNAFFSKTFYNTKNHFFRSKKNFFDENNSNNDLNKNINKDDNDNNNYSIQSSLKKFNLQSKILQKRIINLKYDNFRELNNSDNIEPNHMKSPSIYRYMNNYNINNYNSGNKNLNKFSNHTMNVSLLNESINFMKEKDKDINNNNNNTMKNFFMGRIKRNLRRNDFSYNRSFNISEYNNKYNNINEIEEDNYNKYQKDICYNPKTIKIQNKKIINKTLNNNEDNNYNYNKYNDISRNVYNFNKKRNNFTFLQSNNLNNGNYNYNNNIKSRGDLTISTTLSK